MRELILIIQILLIIMGCISCNNSDKNTIATRTPSGSGYLITMDYSKLKASQDTLILPLSKFVKNIEIIKLERSREAMTSVDIVFVSENYIATHSLTPGVDCKLFRRSDGKFLGNIGARGRGPFEYYELSDVIIDESKGVFLLPWMSDYIFQYDFDGKPLKQIPLAFKINKGVFELTRDSTFIITVAPFKDMTKAFIWEQDFEGNIIKSVGAEPFFVHPDFGVELNQWSDDNSLSIFVFTMINELDSIFCYDKLSGEIYPEFTVDYKDSDFDRDRMYFSIPGYYFGNFIDWERTPSYTAIHRDFFYIEKESLNGGYYKILNDFFAYLQIKKPIFRNGYYTGIYYPELLKEEINSYLRKTAHLENNSEKQELEKFAAGIRRGDNTIIIIGKLKDLER